VTLDRKIARTLAKGVALGSLLAGLATGPAAAAPSNAANEKRLESTVRYLQNVQQPDGGFGNAGSEPSQDFSAWVTFALAADGINPREQSQPDGENAYHFLVGHFQAGVSEEGCAPAICTTTFDRELLVVDATGTSPHEFAGYDLLDEVLKRKLTDGSFAHEADGEGEINDTVWAILALSPINETAVHEAIKDAARWLIEQQQENGSWSWRNKTSPGEVDTTGAAIQALNAADMHDTPAQEKAFRYLREAQEPDGGFPENPGEGEANVASTAWATQAMWSAGQNPEDWLTHSGQETEEPLGYMASLQQPDGHIKWGENKEMNGVWMTAMVAPTFAGDYFPLDEVPDTGGEKAPPEERASSEPASGTSGSTPTDGSDEPGLGGESAQPGSGVIAGGGGGPPAPLFSRPQPASRGDTPGGVRQLHRSRPRGARKHAARRRRNPGVETRAPILTVTTAPASNPDPAHKGKGAGSARNDATTAGSSTAPRSGRKGTGAGSATTDIGSEGAGTGGTRLRARAANAATEAAGHEVRGVLIGASTKAGIQDALEPGAPGLHSAAAGDDQTPWLAIAIGVAIMLLILAGSQLERRRPEAIL
jgi:prenyltransferase beta subunit